MLVAYRSISLPIAAGHFPQSLLSYQWVYGRVNGVSRFWQLEQTLAAEMQW